MRAEGEAEPVSDILLVCTGGAVGASSLVDVTVTLTTNLTSRIMNAASSASEALVLIDDPQPGPLVNMSNGFPYTGQVRGRPGVPAGQTGSGNVYLARESSAASVTWSGVPFVAPGPSAARYLRITNLRANATNLPVVNGLAPIQATVSSTLALTNATNYVGFAAPGFTFSAVTSPASTSTLTFTENFATAFRPRITTTSAGPFSESRQDMPGYVYWTESQFTPCFSPANCSSPPNSLIGLASKGTVLLSHLAGLGAGAASVSVPNQVVTVFAPGLTSEVYLLVNGKPVTASGNSTLPVVGGTVDVLYEVATSNPSAIDQFQVPVALLDAASAPLAFPARAAFAGHLAPLDSTATASPTAPQPRFIP